MGLYVRNKNIFNYEVNNFIKTLGRSDGVDLYEDNIVFNRRWENQNVVRKSVIIP